MSFLYDKLKMKGGDVVGRPAKPSAITNKMMSAKDKKTREDMENKLKGNNDKLKPESHLTLKQIKIFNFIYEELKASGILGNLDKYILSQTAVIIDRINECESLLNNDGVYVRDYDGTIRPNPVVKIRNDYMKDFYRACNELSLSPQARAKFGNINLDQAKHENDALLKVLRG